MHRQSLEIRQQQQLALTPQLQQSIRFLQLSTHDLDQEIAQALQDNPMLERDENYSADDTARQSDADEGAPEHDDELFSPVAPSIRGNAGDDDARPETPQQETLRDHLLRQLHATRISVRERALATLLIDDLDENGYLPMSLEEFAACLPQELQIDPDEVQCALRLLQSFDPVGVGARNLSECLLLQLRPGQTGLEQGNPVLECAREIVRQHLDLLAGGLTARLCAALSAERDVVQAAHALILRLEPKPARNWASSVAEYVRPDVLVRKRAGRWQAMLNPDALPRLSVNRQYEDWLEQAGADNALRQQAQQAHAMIRSLQQRGSTILRVTQEIIVRQHDFFEQGAHAMRPLRLRDIAQELELHESTVSRATKRKYMQTHWGVFELKYFFTGAVAGADGEEASALKIKSMIASLVAGEAPQSPLSDSQLVTLLAGQGVTIARRTVAKYREAAGIETAQRRKARAASALA